MYVGRDAVTGGDRYATRIVHAGRREAEGVLNEMVVAAERGSLVKTEATTGELVDAWFEHARRDFSPKTVRETKGYIDRTIKPGLGGVISPPESMCGRLPVASGIATPPQH